MEAKVYNQEGEETGKVKLPENVFALPWNGDLVHKVITALQARSRRGRAHSKDRGEVRGGGRKPWQQKGTGRARHGSIRSPIWVGGGVTHGPTKEKNYSKKVNKKEKAKALRTILSRKFKEREILFLDDLVLPAPQTRRAKEILNSLGTVEGFKELLGRRRNVALLTLAERQPAAEKSFRNFSNLKIIESRNLNSLDLLQFKYLVMVKPSAALRQLPAGGQK